MRSDDILNQIDGALEDWSVSGDAMRSRPAPDAPAEPSGIRGTTPTVQIWDEAGEWQEIGVTSIDFHIDPPEIDPEFTQAWEEFHDRIARARIARERSVVAAFREIQAALQAVTDADFQHLPEADGCNDCSKPARRRDRPAWQSPYGPAQRRR